MTSLTETKLEYRPKPDKLGHGQKVSFYCGKVKWPYHGSFGNLEKGDRASILAKRVACNLSKSIVALHSFAGENPLFTCSGTIIKWDGVVGTVLTSATLLKGDEDDDDNVTPQPQDVTVYVYLYNREKVQGCISHFDHHYNIAIITIQPTSSLDVSNVYLSPEVDFTWQGVVALGRHLWTMDLMACHGETTVRYVDLDSNDLLSSSCVVSKFGIGGPLIDMSSGEIIGINFATTDENCTPFLSSSIVLRCLDHFDKFGKVFCPWLGLKTRCVDTFDLPQMEAILMKFPGTVGVFVEKVMYGSPAESAGVCPGDIISRCDGISVKSPLEIQNILFEKAGEVIESSSCGGAGSHTYKRRKFSLGSSKTYLEVVIHKGSCGSTEVKSICLDSFTPAIINRWPLEKKRDARVNIVDHKSRRAVRFRGKVW